LRNEEMLHAAIEFASEPLHRSKQAVLNILNQLLNTPPVPPMQVLTLTVVATKVEARTV
jgi:hypothetical protein